MTVVLRRAVPLAVVMPLLLLTTAGCDIVTADLKASARSEWRKSYELQPGGRVEISNVNGKIRVDPSSGNTVEVVAEKTAKAGSDEAAKEALERIEIKEEASPSAIRIETHVQRTSGWFGGNSQVLYTVRVPASAEVKFSTVNGGIEVTGLKGRITAETTNGGVVARDVSGTIDASTTNGGVDVELSQVGEGGVKLGCTNGGIKLRLPSDAKADINASITNGGIESSGLSIETTESTRRRLEGRLNGGGPSIRIEGTNGGIRISAR